MTSKRLSNTIGSMAGSIESAFNRMVMGVRARHMPKSIKKVKKTLQGNRPAMDTAEWDYNDRETEVLDQVSFYPKYMGSTLVEELVDPEPGANYYNTGLSTRALDRIVKMTKNNGLVNVSLNISTKGVLVIRTSDKVTILDVSMSRMAYCTHDKKYSKLVSFIAKNCINDTMECHAFLCDRQKMARSIASALTKSYRQSKGAEENVGESEDELESHDNMETTEDNSPNEDREREEPLHSRLLMNGHDTESHDKNRLTDNQSTTANKGDNLLDLDMPEPEQKTEKVVMRRKSTKREQKPIIVDDDYLPPIVRGRADSDSWAVMAGGGDRHDSTNVDLELEFSNFARSRSQTNLNDLHASVHSAWDI